MLIRKMRSALHDARRYGRFLGALPDFMRRRMTLDEAHAIFHDRMARRADNFLSVARDAVFAHDGSPYRALFDVAGCTFADLEQGVYDNGLEPTLEALRDAGVYVTFKEFWARKPIVRGGREIPVRWSSFDNPLLDASFRMSTGGSSGRARPIDVDIAHLWARVPEQIICDTIQGFTGAPVAIWFDGLPGNAPGSLLTRVPTGNVPERWFTPTARRDARPLTDLQAQRYRWAEAGILATARMNGVRLPRPEALGLDEADAIARWVGRTLAEHGRAGVKSLLSRSLRVCLAGEELGLDLTGLTISGGGEPPTPAKAAAVARTGARLVCNYHFQEAGAIGKMCMNPVDENDQHLMQHHLAMITRSRTVPGFDVEVGAFCFTTLLPSARKLMINVETDDYGIVEERRCGCPWEEFGFSTHLRQIRSFRKLTGEGVTLVGTDVVRILEEVLPARFGGSPLDYQLLEEEDHRGFTRMSVVVSPRVTLDDEAAVVRTFLDELGRGAAQSLWRQAGTLRVQRREPVWTERGKLMPLHLAHHLGRRTDVDEDRDGPTAGTAP
jgi:hypothetical protein